MLLAADVSAAVPLSKPFDFGFKVGATLTNTTGDWLNNVGGVTVAKKSRLGYLGGAFVSRKIKPYLAVQAEVQYVQKGIRFSGSQDTGYGIATVDGSIGVSYLEVPVLVRFLVAEKSPLKPSLYAGPVAGFKTGLSLSAKASLGGYGSEVSASDLAVYKQALNDNMKNSDWSVAFGGAVRFGMAQVDLRYTLGILDISKEPSGATSVTLKNTALQLTTGVVF